MIPNYQRPPLSPQLKSYRADRKAEKRKAAGTFKRTRAQVRVIVFDRESGECERCGRKVSFDVAPYADDHAEVNEPGLRSLGADPLDPNQCELVCHACHFGGPSGAHAPTKDRMERKADAVAVAVEIVEHETGAIVRRLEVMSRHIAERVDRGLNINLNHDKFFTRITEDIADVTPGAADQERAHMTDELKPKDDDTQDADPPATPQADGDSGTKEPETAAGEQDE